MRRRTMLKALAVAGMVGRIAHVQAASDYKALIALYLLGGNDGENTLIRYDTAGYANYAAIRTPASGINISRDQLLPIQPRSTSFAYGFHPSCGPMQALFNSNRLAVIANMGMLVRPTTKAALETQGAPTPASLFSHTDQQLEIQSADHVGAVHTGWGGRAADRLDALNAGASFPPLTTTAGLESFTSGMTTIPLAVPLNSGVEFRNGPKQYTALRDAALVEILSGARTNVYEDVVQLYAEDGLAASSVIAPLLRNDKSTVAPFFSGLGSDVSNQLKVIALLIEGRAQLGLNRQIFYTRHGAYDTHGAQPSHHSGLLADLSAALKAFHDAMDAIGLGSSVTCFTLTDFGRTFKPASNQGTDHGWGNYAFVSGGAVKGGDFYGIVPTLALDGPDDFGKEGRWIPTTSLEQYGATLCRWFGIAEVDLPYVFPNIGAFPNTNLGFMS